MRLITRCQMNIRVPGPHASIWVVAESMASAVFSLISLLMIGRVIGPAAAGLGVIPISAFILLEVLTAALFPDALVQRRHLTRRHTDSAVTAAVVLGALCGLMMAAGAALLDFGELDRGAVPLWLALAPLLPLAAFSGTISGLLLREQRFRMLSMRLLIGQPMALGFGLLTAKAGLGAWAMVAVQVVSVLITFVLMLSAVRGRFAPYFDWPALADLLPVALPTVTGVFVMLGKYRFFLLALGFLVTPVVLALSNFAFRLLDAALALVWQCVAKIGISRLCALQDDRNALAEAYGDLTELQAILGFAICGGVAVTSHDLVAVLMGPSWAASSTAIGVAAVASTLNFVAGDYTSLFVAVGKAKRNFYVAVCSVVVPLLALLILMPTTPATAAIAWCAQAIVLPPILTIVVLRELDRPLLWLLRKLFPGAIGCAAMIASVMTMQRTVFMEPVARLSGSVILGAVVFILVTWIAIGRRSPRALAVGLLHPRSGTLFVT